MNTNVDSYFTDGCGRCKLGGTPNCKVHKWPNELKILRQIVLECGLTEESKWGVPCYTYQQKNIVIVSAFKEYSALSFFKGSLLSDSENILTQATENSQSSRSIRFTKPTQIIELANVLKAYIFEAIEVEKAGLKVPVKKVEEFDIPEEFTQKMNELPLLKIAFDALTPGRKKSYLFHFAQAKQSKTRISRIEKCIPKILEGKGFNDR